MLKKSIYPIFLLLVAFLLFSSSNATTIVSGIAIFLIGMVFMEDGFKLFGGGVVEKILSKSTSNIPKAIGSGFLITAIIQSSSLVSIIIISFLSAELITLSGAIGVIFGSNIGTTTTAWIVSAFGVKINIAHFAMPMLVFGVILRFNKNQAYKGVGSILVGLGFVFLGIGYMKEGFETLKDGLDLAKFAIDGYLGVLVYVAIGVLATIILQSSSATMALIITALVTGQIIYLNALELAIGANIGTTVTAILGSLASNENGKRLAVAHFIFNAITGFIAIAFLHQFASLVNYIAPLIAIANDDYAMKLALFHTIFNIVGVLVVSPFTYKLVPFLETLFTDSKKNISRAKYLDKVVIKVPDAAIEAITKEIIHMYNNSTKILYHAISLHVNEIIDVSDEKILEVVEKSDKPLNTDIDAIYERKIKLLYGDIISYATLAQDEMDSETKTRIYSLKIASRDIVEAIKDVKELQKNISRYIKSNNSFIKIEYNDLRVEIVKIINSINKLRDDNLDDFDILSKIEILKGDLSRLEITRNSRVEQLIRANNIDTKMATSLINDHSFANKLSNKLINAASILWIKDTQIQHLGDES